MHKRANASILLARLMTMKSALSSSPESQEGHKPNLCSSDFALRSSLVSFFSVVGVGAGVRLTA